MKLDASCSTRASESVAAPSAVFLSATPNLHAAERRHSGVARSLSIRVMRGKKGAASMVYASLRIDPAPLLPDPSLDSARAPFGRKGAADKETLADVCSRTR